MNMNERIETGLVEPDLITPGKVPGTGSVGNIFGIAEEQFFIKSRTNHHSQKKNFGAPA